MCELLAAKMEEPQLTATYFTVGLFSTMDAIMDQPIEAVLAELPLKQPVSEAIQHYKGKMGRALQAAIAYERGEWDELEDDIVESDTIVSVYIEALNWCRDFIDSIESLRAAWLSTLQQHIAIIINCCLPVFFYKGGRNFFR